MTKLYGSLEAGGTKFVCAVGDENYNVVEKVQFPTTKPIETIDKCIEFFSKFEDLVGLAIGSFGPIDIDPNSNTYGFITTTPKPNWANVDIVGAFRRALNVPIYFTTDVNSSAYGEVVARNTMWLNTQWMWKKNSRVFVLSTMAVWKALRLVLVSKLVQVFVGKTLNSTAMYGIFKPTTSHKQQ